MKKTAILIFLVLFALFPLHIALAATSTDSDFETGKEVIVQVGSKEFQINGREHMMDAEPFNFKGRVYAPMDFFGLAFSTVARDASWHVGTDLINLVVPAQGDRFLALTMKPGSNQLVIDYSNDEEDSKILPFTYGKTITMDVTPVEKRGQIYLPLRWVAEACDYTVTWDRSAKGERVLLSAGFVFTQLSC